MQVMVDRAPPAPPGADDRVVAAALRCIARWGLAKTTVDDVAREAGVGRATLYRLFPGGRDALLEAVVRHEVERLGHRLGAAAATAVTLEDLVVAWFADAAELVADHPALQFLLAHEPESVLPQLAFGRLDALLERAAALGGPLLERWIDQPEDRARAVEWMARVLLSYTLAPSPDVDVRDRESLRRFARAFIIPGLTRSSA